MRYTSKTGWLGGWLTMDVGTNDSIDDTTGVRHHGGGNWTLEKTLELVKGGI